MRNDALSGSVSWHTIETTSQFFIDHCLGKKKQADCLVAYYDGKPAGFVLSYDTMNFIGAFRRSLVDLLYVYEDFRGRGIGEALMESCVQAARKRGCRVMKVGAEKTNTGANDFYKRIGWELRQPKANYYQTKFD